MRWVKHWSRWKLKTFLLVTGLLAATLTQFWSRVAAQQRAIRWVENEGGWVYYHHERFEACFNEANPLASSTSGVCLISEPPVPDWILQIVSVDVFSSVREVWTDLSIDLDFAALRGFRNLELIVVHSELPDDQLVKLRQLFPDCHIRPFDDEDDLEEYDESESDSIWDAGDEITFEPHQ